MVLTAAVLYLFNFEEWRIFSWLLVLLLNAFGPKNISVKIWSSLIQLNDKSEEHNLAQMEEFSFNIWWHPLGVSSKYWFKELVKNWKREFYNGNDVRNLCGASDQQFVTRSNFSMSQHHCNKISSSGSYNGPSQNILLEKLDLVIAT